MTLCATDEVRRAAVVVRIVEFVDRLVVAVGEDGGFALVVIHVRSMLFVFLHDFVLFADLRDRVETGLSLERTDTTTVVTAATRCWIGT